MSHILRRLISTVSWSSKLVNPYGNNPARKQQIEQIVVKHATDKGVDARGADTAIILGAEHVGGTNAASPNHVTVEFKAKNGQHITTHHVSV